MHKILIIITLCIFIILILLKLPVYKFKNICFKSNLKPSKIVFFLTLIYCVHKNTLLIGLPINCKDLFIVIFSQIQYILDIFIVL